MSSLCVCPFKQHSANRLTIILGPLYVYLLQVIWGCLMLYATAFDLSTRSYVIVCAAFGAVSILSGVIGLYGVCFESYMAIRATFAIVVLENSLIFLLASFLLVDSIRPIYYKDVHHVSKVIRHITTNWVVGLAVSIALYVSALVSCICLWTLSEFQTNIEIEQDCAREALLAKEERPAFMHKHTVLRFDPAIVSSKSTKYKWNDFMASGYNLRISGPIDVIGQETGEEFGNEQPSEDQQHVSVLREGRKATTISDRDSQVNF